ncbi:MAG TPA: glycine cleavage system protein GcvH [Actinomycetota bacterium]
MEFPEDLRYTKEHEWARPEGDGARVRVGITDFAQDALGDVVYVDLPQTGARVEAHEPLGEVESTKSVSDVYSPVSGTILERNTLIEDHPELVNEQPYGDGWLVVIGLDDASGIQDLLDAAAYRDFAEGSDADGS